MMSQAQFPDGCPQDSLVEALVEDPANPPKLATLAGFLGASARDDSCRVYVDPTLGDWFDVNKSDIVHVVRLPGDDDAFGGSSVVWVRQDATLERSPAYFAEHEGEFLQGDISGEVGYAAYALRRGGSAQSRLWKWSKQKKRWVCI
jgi:hypothetical protein